MKRVLLASMSGDDVTLRLWKEDDGGTTCGVDMMVTPYENLGLLQHIPTGEPVRCTGTLARLEGERCLERDDGADGPIVADSIIDAIRAWADGNGY